ncbi:MAG: carboxypeptidase-like regulatory domain-containing protein [Planctomycetota bacterium]
MLYLSSPGTREHSITAAAVLVGDRSTIQSFGFGPRNAEGIGRVIKQMREAPPNPIVLQAAPGKSVTGRVVSTDGDPIADALVSLPGPMVNRTNADSDGSFVLHVNVDESGNIKGDLIVTADMISKSPRYFPTTVTLKAGGKDESYRDIKIEMPRRIDVSTIIKDSTGRPLQDVTLSFTKADQPYLREIGKSNERGEIRGSVPAEKLQLFLTTPRDDLGLLSFHSLNRNRYLQSESFPPLRSVDLSNNMSLVHLDPFILGRTAAEDRRLELSLLDSQRRPLANAEIQVMDYTEASEHDSRAGNVLPKEKRSNVHRTNAKGFVRIKLFENLSEDAFVTVQTTDEPRLKFPLRLSSMDDSTLILPKPVKLTGKITRDGKPWPNFRLQLNRSSPKIQNFTSRALYQSYELGNISTDPNGVFEATVLPDQFYFLIMRGSDDSQHMASTLSPKLMPDGDYECDAVDLISGDKQLAGIVVDQDGRAVSNAELSIGLPGTQPYSNDATTRWIDFQGSNIRHTDDQGRFDIQGIPSGQYQLNVRPNRNAVVSGVRSASFEVEAGQTDLRFTLPKVKASRPPIRTLNPVRVF